MVVKLQARTHTPEREETHVHLPAFPRPAFEQMPVRPACLFHPRPRSHRRWQGSHGDRLVVGLTGYPNVGKSSTINALFGAKKTAVAPTPGKTKHFQTLNISEDLQLCDCPGLVMPQYAHSRADMVAAGVIPIDRLTDVRAPVGAIAQRISKKQLAAVYGIAFAKPKGWAGEGVVHERGRSAALVCTGGVGSLMAGWRGPKLIFSRSPGAVPAMQCNPQPPPPAGTRARWSC